jgi:hypothetical protein
VIVPHPLGGTVHAVLQVLDFPFNGHSSHCSPDSTVPFPHTIEEGFHHHPVIEDGFPHPELPHPDVAGGGGGISGFFLQVFEHASSLTVFPSSHSSPVSPLPLPQIGLGRVSETQ